MMIGKKDGRANVHKLLARSGYGRDGAQKASERAPSQQHDDIASHLAAVEREVHAEGGIPKGRMDRKPRAGGGGNWIAGAIKHKGALHRELGVPEGEKIPAKKLEKASHSSNPTLAKRANLAKTLKKFH